MLMGTPADTSPDASGVLTLDLQTADIDPTAAHPECQMRLGHPVDFGG